MREKNLMENPRQEKSMRYLLGKFSVQEIADFEAQCFDDDALFDETVDLENDLMQSYIRGELSMPERQEFETGYLITPARRRKLEFAQALEHRLFGTGETLVSAEPKFLPTGMPPSVGLSIQSWPVRVVSGAVALIAIATISWLAVTDHRLNRELSELKTQQVESRKAQQGLQAQMDMLNARLRESASVSHGHQQFLHVQPQGSDIMAFNLTPGLPRSAGTIKRLIVPPRTLLVELKLYLEDDKHASYRASLDAAEGKQLWRKVGLKSQMDSKSRRFVSLEIPPDILSHGDYLIKLGGVTGGGKIEETIAAYPFSVAEH